MATAKLPIAASEVSAAKLLDMATAKFRELVDAGYLPRGREIAPGVIRWNVDELARIAKGEAADGEYKW